jgi:acetyl esterase/lipase
MTLHPDSFRSLAGRLLRLLALAALAPALGCMTTHPRPARRPPSPPAAIVRDENDIVYSRAGGEDLKLDVCAPKNLRGPFPAVVLIHGGGWEGGCKGGFQATSLALAERGYVALTIDYRLAPRHKFPAQLDDCRTAVRWLRAHAERYQVDPDRVGVFGASAGGHLALLLALAEPKGGSHDQGEYPEQSCKVQAVVNLMGPTDLSRPGWPEYTEGLLTGLVGGSRDKIPAAYVSASPLNYVRPGLPPVLTIHGTVDRLVPYEQAKLLHAALLEAGGVSRLETMEGKGHGEGWTADDLKHNGEVILDFLNTHLKPR